MRRSHSRRDGRGPLRTVVATLATAAVVIVGAATSAPAADPQGVSGLLVLPPGVVLPADDTITVSARSGLYTLGSVEVHPDDLEFAFAGLYDDPVQLVVTEDAGVVADGWYTSSGLSWDRDDAVDVALGSDVTVQLGAATAIQGSIALPAGLTAARTNVGVSALVWQDDQPVTVQSGTVTVTGGQLTYRIGGLRAGEAYRLSFGDAAWALRSGYFAGAGGPLVQGWDDATAVTAPATVALTPGAEPRLAGSLLLPAGVDVDDPELVVTAHQVGSEQIATATAKADPAVPGSLMFVIPGLDPDATYTLSVFDYRSRLASGYVGPTGWRTSAAGARVLTPSTTWLELDVPAAASFSGQVVMPDGYVQGQFPPVVGAYAAGDLVASGDIASDGTFTVTGVLPTSSYDVRLTDASKELVSGHVGADGTVTAGAAPVGLLTPQVLTIRPQLTGRVTVHLTFPDGDRTVGLHALDENNQPGVDAYAHGPGDVSVVGLEPGKDYYLQIAGGGDIADGYYAGDGVTPSDGTGRAVAVHAGDAISITVRKTFSIVPVIKLPAGSCTDTFDDTLVWLSLLSEDGSTWIQQGGAQVDTWVAPSFQNLRPGSIYALSITSADPGVGTGYVRADGTVGASAGGARRFTAGATITVPLTVDPTRLFKAVTPPTVSGTARVGSKLTATAATWSKSGATAVLAWYRDGTPISGATGSSYTVAAADQGARLSVRATATTPTCRAVSTQSAGTATVVAGTIANTTKPSITGSARLGSRLTATAGTWSVAGLTYSYQWFRGTAAISGATSSSYTLAVADHLATISVRVTASRPGYTSAAATSAATGTVALGTLGNRSAPTISGSVRVGERLTAGLGTWSASGLTYRLQWLRGATPITGAQASTYLLTPADRGAAITVTVTVSRSGYRSASATSAATGSVGYGVVTNLTAPTFSGTAKVGKALTASVGTWSPGGLTYSYRWLRDGSAIAGATAPAYRVTQVDVGHTLSLRVVASKTGYTTTTVTSSKKATVLP